MTRHRRRLSFLLLVAALVLMVFASLALGSNPLSLSAVIEALSGRGDTISRTVVIDQRIPRTLVVMLVGAALGVAGALMQALTRNPLADPGILGINAGASLAVVTGVAFLGIQGIGSYIWLSLIGAVLASIGVYVLGGVGRASVSPARLTLAGVAISMAISAFVQMILLSNQNAFNEFRFWAAGSVEGRGVDVLLTISWMIVLGLFLALLVAPSLNALSLGEETGKALGVKVGLTRTLVVISVTFLCGAATAAVGPIMFVGLAVPYMARAICGADQRLVIPTCVVAAPVFLLFADIAARLVVAPLEIQTGIMSALVGGPVFLYIVRGKNLETFS
ncbi:iron ABC transporter permease [Corynebacterium sp. ES2775-CONJ]|uniref:FecCD family ABC transporter permease n=1 Tax=Corynebacterium sp. ES2775-CONJ TaxID=2974029 RepID=UPI00216A3D9B|nr:iron chelate uptake ABC transporter family permease subunit [Corynebacterium sp. ES2775-CONJ]MCS4489628.1 iron chelate uptake ABC transporter family permease subunit [Corynebacterium sp. ES2775-CONJ]